MSGDSQIMFFNVSRTGCALVSGQESALKNMICESVLVKKMIY